MVRIPHRRDGQMAARCGPGFPTFLALLSPATVGRRLPARLAVDDPTHPAVKGLPASYVSPDNEW